MFRYKATVKVKCNSVNAKTLKDGRSLAKQKIDFILFILVHGCNYFMFYVYLLRIKDIFWVFFFSFYNAFTISWYGTHNRARLQIKCALVGGDSPQHRH